MWFFVAGWAVLGKMGGAWRIMVGMRHSGFASRLAIVWLFLVAAPVLAEKPTTIPTAPPAPANPLNGPQITYVGFYINDVYDLDLKQSTYIADFYVWFRWNAGPDGGLNPSDFEFMNGTLDLKEHPYKIHVGDTWYLSYHCRGTFHIAFNYRRYPLDQHDLVIELEHSVYEASQIKFEIDADNMHNLRPLTLTGWDMNQPTYEVQDHLYHTTFGEPTEKTGGSSTYSRVVGSIHIAREGDTIFVKTFLGLFISVAISFLSFLFKPNETDPRFAVGVAAIFGAVSSEIVASGNLPDMPYLTLADKIHLFSLFVIFLSLLQSCLSLRLFRENKHATAVRIDRICSVAFPICYATVVTLLTFVY
jgi:hypothetical protein